MAVRKQDEYEGANEELRYYDMLYDFAGVVTKANEQSFQGWEPKRIAGTLRKAAEAFCRLCMADTVVGGKEQDVAQEKPHGHEGEPQASAQGAAPGQEKEKAPVPDNFLHITPDGWGLCPVCGSKVLKVTATTRLENFPVFCKRCRADHLVNWWNADNQRILYKRQVNDRYLRDQAYKGTGLRAFQSTGTSAPERAVVRA